MRRRVVITGMGAITPVGNDVQSAWQAIVAGRSGVGRITAFDPRDMKTQIAAEIKDFDPTQYMDRKEARRMGRVIQIAVNAAGQAVEDAGLQPAHLDLERAGVVFGSGVGGIATIIEGQELLRDKGPARISPFFVPSVLPDMSAGYIAIQHGFRGPNMSVVTACATGNNSLGEAARMIRHSVADIMIAGGTEAAILPLTVVSFDQMGALACNCNDNPRAALRPFDRDRSGFVMGEGAAALVLEEREHALKRGAHIYAELIGYGTSADAHHIAAPDPSGRGAVRSMQLAIEDAGITPDQIQYINAHGTGTDLNDVTETRAIRTVFGPAADNLAVTSTKAVTGHQLGAAGAVEAIVCVLALVDGVIPPTMNHEHPDPDCDLDYAPATARRAALRTVMSNAFGFGGHNASLIFTRNGDAA
jgi:3-oxoacyl-[acyl-carrier-protein] synthase II